MTIEDIEGNKLKDFNGNLIKWEYGEERNGRQIYKGTSISIVYQNKQGKINKIGIDNFSEQYSIGGGTLLFQEKILGLKFPSLYTGDNELHNQLMESVMTAPPVNTSTYQISYTVF